MSDLFQVWQFFLDGWSEQVGVDLPPREAVMVAKRLTESIGGRVGTTQRITIVDTEGFNAFEWRFGEGVVFPKPEDPVTREEHLTWAKNRALEYLPERPDLAVSSFSSDLNKHTETASRAIEAGASLTKLLIDRDNTHAGSAPSAAARVRRYIEEFK